VERTPVFQRGVTDEDKVGRFVAGSSVAFLATVLSGTLSFVWAFTMSRILGPAGFGIAKPFLDIFWILTMSVSLGVPQAMITFISKNHQSDPEEARMVMAEGTRVLFITAFLFAFAAGILVTFIGGSMSSQMKILSWLMIAAVIFRQMYFSMFGTLGGYQTIDLVAMCNISFPLSMLSGSVIMVKKAKKLGYGPGEMVVACAAGIPFGAGVQYVVSHIVSVRGGLSVGGMFRWGNELKGRGIKLLAFGWKAAVASIAGSSVSFISPALVSIMAYRIGCFGPTVEINARNAGFFSVGYTFAMAPMLIVGMIYSLLPAVSEAHSQGNRDLMQKYFDLSMKYAFTIIMLILAVYLTVAGDIVEFFSGPDYPATKLGPLTATLGAGMSACMLMIMLANFLIGIRKPLVPAVVTVVMLSLMAVSFVSTGVTSGSLILIAATFDIVVLAGFVCLVLYVIRLTGLMWPWGKVLRPVAAGLVTAAVISGFPSGSSLLFLPALVVAPPVYLLVLGWTGAIGAPDFEMLRDTLSSTPAGRLMLIVNIAEKIVVAGPLADRKECDKPDVFE